MSIWKHKKGQAEEVLVDFVSFLVFLVILMIFFFLFNVKGCSIHPAKQLIIGEIDKSPDATMQLLNFLRTDAAVDGKEMNMADVIALSKDGNGDYEELLEKEVYQILGKIAPGEIDGQGNFFTSRRKLKRGDYAYYFMVDGKMLSRSLYNNRLTDCKKCYDGESLYDLQASSSNVYVPALKGEPIKVTLYLFEIRE